MEKKKKKKYSRTDRSNPWNRIYHSWFIRSFYSDTDYLCGTRILYGSDRFE